MVEEEIRVWSIGGVTLAKYNLSTHTQEKKNLSQYHISITDSTLTVLGLNLDLCDEKVVTDYLKYRIALSCAKIFD
jgi:hypothetical protein